MTEKRNPKEVAVSLVICFVRKQSVHRVRGRQDGENEREIKKREKIKRCSRYVNLPVSETTQSVNILIKTEKRPQLILKRFLDIMKSNI